MVVGVYKKKLIKVFIIIALFITVISSVLFSTFFYFVNADSYIDTIRNISVAKADTIRLALDIISDTHEKMKIDEDVINWAYSEAQSPKYYYYSVKIYQKLAKKSSSIASIDYETIITKPDDTTFVISQSGTTSKQYFIDGKIGDSTWKEIVNNRTGSGLVPHFSDGELKDIIYYTFGTSELLFLTRIPVSSFVKADEEFAIYMNGTIYTEKEEILRPELLPFISNSDGSISEFKADNSFVYVLDSSIPGLDFIFIYPKLSSDFVSLVIFSAGLFLLVLVVSFLATMQISRKLYAPIFDIISRIDSQDDEKADEFALLSKNLDSLAVLKNQLNVLSEENSNFAITRYFSELLYSPHPIQKEPLTNNSDKHSYAVALFEYQFDDSKNDEFYLQIERTSMMMLLKDLNDKAKYYYINLSVTRFALVFEDTDVSDMKKYLTDICENDSLDIDFALSLSDTRFGQENICISFKQAEKIIEYKHLLHLNTVLMQKDLPDENNNYFYYPIVIENKIVSCAVVGDIDSLINTYDSMIYENLVNLQLSNEARRNLMYSLIGTLIRVLQELKMSATELIGREFDFPWLYSNWANDKLVERIRNNFKEIAEAVCEKRKLSKTDEFLLDKMRDYIFNNYSDDIMLIDISEYCNITPKYCSSLFKKLSNENFKTFLNEYRIERAAEKIKENPYIRINDLALSVGFNSANTFIRVFKSFQNMTPKAYAELVLRDQKED